MDLSWYLYRRALNLVYLLIFKWLVKFGNYLLLSYSSSKYFKINLFLKVLVVHTYLHCRGVEAKHFMLICGKGGEGAPKVMFAQGAI